MERLPNPTATTNERTFDQLASKGTEGLRLISHPDGAAFLEAAGDFLLRNEAAHNLVLGLAAEHRSAAGSGQPDWWVTVQQAGSTVGYAFRTPPHKLSLSQLPDGVVELLVEAAAEKWRTLPAVLGPEPAAGRFAASWSALRGVACRRGARQRIYQLERVTDPRPASGKARMASLEDAELLAGWMEDFQDSVAASLAEDPAELVDRLLKAGSMWLWCDGEPVSMAARAADTPNGSRVGFVYTPPTMRKRGYAASLTAALSRSILDEGRKFCFLYTDLDNPTSNSIYQAIGYRPVCDVGDWLFD